MIGSLVSSFVGNLTGAFTSPITIIDHDSFGFLFISAHPMRVDVVDESVATKFTVENGETRSDHVVKKPIEINIQFMLVDLFARNQFENIRSAKEANTLVTIQTKMSTYTRFLIESITHTESANIAQGAVVDVRFTEWREVAPEYGELQQQSVSQKSQSSTVERGKQAGKEAVPQQKSSLAARMSDWAMK